MDVGGFSDDRRLETLESTCHLKTGRPNESLESGAIVAGADDSVVNAFSRYGCALGLAFQITDDTFNVTGDAKRWARPSIPTHHVTKSRSPNSWASTKPEAMLQQVAEAKQAHSSMGEPAWFRTELADHLLERQS